MPDTRHWTQYRARVTVYLDLIAADSIHAKRSVRDEMETALMSIPFDGVEVDDVHIERN